MSLDGMLLFELALKLVCVAVVVAAAFNLVAVAAVALVLVRRGAGASTKSQPDVQFLCCAIELACLPERHGRQALLELGEAAASLLQLRSTHEQQRIGVPAQGLQQQRDRRRIGADSCTTSSSSSSRRRTVRLGAMSVMHWEEDASVV